MSSTLMLRVTGELYLSYWKGVNLRRIISSVPLNHGVFWLFNTRHKVASYRVIKPELVFLINYS